MDRPNIIKLLVIHSPGFSLGGARELSCHLLLLISRVWIDGNKETCRDLVDHNLGWSVLLVEKGALSTNRRLSRGTWTHECVNLVFLVQSVKQATWLESLLMEPRFALPGRSVSSGFQAPDWVLKYRVGPSAPGVPWG